LIPSLSVDFSTVLHSSKNFIDLLFLIPSLSVELSAILHLSND
jgi:hypothetical protein